jgi:hypothetical protein
MVKPFRFQNGGKAMNAFKLKAFAELISNDDKARHYAALASIYMGRRLATGEFEMECSDERFDDFITCVELINAALNEDRLAELDGQPRPV